MTVRYQRPVLLGPDHRVDGFECRSPEQTQWLHFHARQAHAAGTAKVLVVSQVDDTQVVAYYAWSMASLQTSAAPQRLLKGAGQYPQPIALLVHAESTSARDFYLHLVPEFEPSPTDDLHLVLLMKDIRQTVKG